MNYVWNLPTKVLFGEGMLNELHNEEMPGKKAMIVISNGKSMKNNGWIDEVIDELEQAGVESVVFDKIGPNPTEPDIMDGVIFARGNEVDFIVGLGGGSVLDATTIIAAVVPQKDGGRVWDYVNGGTGGGRPLEEKSLPYIEITTTAGTGSEVDRWGVVTNPETHEKIGFQGDFAFLAIVDARLMLTVPPEYTAYQGFDALFHSIEGYISTARTAPAQMVEIAAIGNIAQYLPIAVKDGDNLDAREKVAFANTMSGYSMELGSCTSEHSLEHALSGNHPDLPHGAGLIMISLAYFKHFIDKHVCDEKFMEMAIALGAKQIKGPYDFLQALERLMRECGVADLKMSDYGISPSEFPRLVKEARETMGGLFEFDPEPLTDEEVEAIYLASYR
mgnify:FL=1